MAKLNCMKIFNRNVTKHLTHHDHGLPMAITLSIAITILFIIIVGIFIRFYGHKAWQHFQSRRVSASNSIWDVRSRQCNGLTFPLHCNNHNPWILILNSLMDMQNLIKM